MEIPEANTKISELCQEVAPSEQVCAITHRGEPPVRLEPMRNTQIERESIWKRRERHLEQYGPLDSDEPDFKPPTPLPASWTDPLA